MDLQDIVDAAAELDGVAEDVFLISLRVPKLQLTDDEGLTKEALALEKDVLDLDRDELGELADKADDDVALGPLLNPGMDLDRAMRAERRVKAFCDAHDALSETDATDVTERIEALRELQESM